MRLPRLSPRRYQQISLFALIAVCFIIVTGASVRLTGSGLGCSQWPACENDRLVAPLELHPMIEFGNRVVTGLVSLAVTFAVLGSLIRVPRRRDLTWWSLGLVMGVLAQIVLGGLAVLFELAPIFVTLHFLASIVLVWSGLVLHHRAGVLEPVELSRAAQPIVASEIVMAGRALVGLAAAVLVTGTIVTGSGPHSGDPTAGRYGFHIADVARIHSIVVWLFLAAALATLWRLEQTGAPTQVDRRGRVLVFAILVQGALGYAQYVAEVPAHLVIIHVLGAVLVFVATLLFHLGLFTRPGAAPDRDHHLDLDAAAPERRGTGRADEATDAEPPLVAP